MNKLEKVIVMSIHKHHDDNIGSGVKKFEGRKSRLSLGTWIYLVSTKSSGGDGKIHRRIMFDRNYTCLPTGNLVYFNNVKTANNLKITPEELYKYSNGKHIFCHHISKVEVFDKPMELSDFISVKYLRDYGVIKENGETLYPRIAKAPQSYMWAYVESEDKA